jgi:hypothetical protein
MPITLQDAIDHLYHVAVTKGKSRSTDRLRVLAEYCVQELSLRGLTDPKTEQKIAEGGRDKNWDVAWKYNGKYRLAISLKSILANISGALPNRIDDLMGEVANAQLYSPEIVLGYIIVMNKGVDSYSPKHKSTWIDLMRSRLRTLANRMPPNWTIGSIEGFAIVEVDFSSTAQLIRGAGDVNTLLDILEAQVRDRNPNV